MKKRRRGKQRHRKAESHESEFKRNVYAYQAKMSGNAYLQTSVWIILAGESVKGEARILAFKPDGKNFTELLVFSTRARAEAYLEDEPAIGGNTTVKDICLANVVVVAMTGVVRNIAIDMSSDELSHEMLNIIKMKADFDAGLSFSK